MGQSQSSTTFAEDVKIAISDTVVKQAADCSLNSTVKNKITFEGDLIASSGGSISIDQGTNSSFDFTCTQDQKVQQQMKADMKAKLTSKIQQKLDGLVVGVNESTQILRSTSELIDQLKVDDIAKCASNLQTNNTQDFKGRVIAINGGNISIKQRVSDVIHQTCVQNQLTSNQNYRNLSSTLDAASDQTTTGLVTANSMASTSACGSSIWMIGGVIVIFFLFGGMTGGMGGGKGGGGGSGGGGQTMSGGLIAICSIILLIWCCCCSCCQPQKKT